VYDVDQLFKEVVEMTRVLSIAKNRYYFVHESCGNVYELYHDTLKRIDLSFPHRNQYGSVMYAWKGNVFMFGGYGFFQVKNVFTRFVPRAREWFEVAIKSKDCPAARTAPLFFLGENSFYLLGGINRNQLKGKTIQDCWEYDCKSKTWKKLGDLSELLAKEFNLFDVHENLPNEISRMSNRIIEFDIAKNKWSSYENPLVLNMNKIVSSKNHAYLMYVLSNSNNKNLSVVVQKFSELKEFKIGEYNIYQKPSVFSLFPKEDYLWISLILNFFLFTLLFYIRRMHKVRFLQRAQKKLRKTDFSSTEWEVLSLIRIQGEMELSALNTYFNEEGLSHETLKKRRESFVKNLRIKIALITRKPIDEILVESKHNVDKRMKIIHWNEDIDLETEGSPENNEKEKS
jgi:hypothetical protein